MEQLNKVIHILNELTERAADLRRSSGASRLSYKILSVETDSIDVKIENWNNNFYTIDLNSNDVLKLYRAEVREYESYVNHCKLVSKAHKENAVLVAGTLCHVKNDNVDSFYHHRRAEYVLQINGEYLGTWYGFNAGDAIENAIPYLKKVPTTAALKKSSVA